MVGNISSDVGILTKLIMTYVQFCRYGYHVLIVLIFIGMGYWLVKKRKLVSLNDMKHIVFLFILLNLNILSFFEVAYYSPIAGRMLVCVDSIIFCIIVKFIIIYNEVNSFKVLYKIKLKYFYLLLSLLVILVTYAYYNVHLFILNKQMDISRGVVDSKKFVEYKSNFIFNYIVYFDNERTFTTDFVSLYSKVKIN